MGKWDEYDPDWERKMIRESANFQAPDVYGYSSSTVNKNDTTKKIITPLKKSHEKKKVVNPEIIKDPTEKNELPVHAVKVVKDKKEKAYNDIFLQPYLSPKKQAVRIDKRFCKMIKYIDLETDVSIETFINNCLKHHFETYAKEILKITGREL